MKVIRVLRSTAFSVFFLVLYTGDGGSLSILHFGQSRPEVHINLWSRPKCQE